MKYLIISILILCGCSNRTGYSQPMRYVSDGEIGCWEFYEEPLSVEDIDKIMEEGEQGCIDRNKPKEAPKDKLKGE